MNTIRIAAALFAVAVLNLSQPAIAADESHGIEVVDAWAKASLAGANNGAAYVTLSNESGQPDRILGVESPVATTPELHTHMMHDGIMKMRPLEAVDLAPGEAAKMAPGGLHVMLIGLTRPLVEGETFPLTLILERSGPVQVDVTVKAANAKDGMHDGMKMEEGGHGAMDKDAGGHGKMKMEGTGHGAMDKDGGGHGKMKMQSE